ncbi:MAG: T9SS type A sorting domain-containing protein, partial [Bacteroidetes bacterium]|nr:T9SS type A sorting domain-containing protein [Bacteroidota bacterium]
VTAMSAYGKNVFASVNFTEVYLSTDEGNSWIQANNGLKGWIESFAIGDTDVFVGTSGGGVFIFKSSNRTWIPVNEGLGDLGVYSLAAANGQLYAGTGSHGVWKRPIAEMVLDGIRNIKTDMPFGYRLYQNYPNPFNPTTVIDYLVPKPGYVSLTVYDILGRKVATLVSGNEFSGLHSVTFNASRFASGIYFYRLIESGCSQVRKMLLLK